MCMWMSWKPACTSGCRSTRITLKTLRKHTTCTPADIGSTFKFIYLPSQSDEKIYQEFPMPAPKATAFPDTGSVPPRPGNNNPPSAKISFLNISQERSKRQASTGSSATGNTPKFNVSSKVSCFSSLLLIFWIT